MSVESDPDWEYFKSHVRFYPEAEELLLEIDADDSISDQDKPENFLARYAEAHSEDLHIVKASSSFSKNLDKISRVQQLKAAISAILNIEYPSDNINDLSHTDQKVSRALWMDLVDRVGEKSTKRSKNDLSAAKRKKSMCGKTPASRLPPPCTRG